MSVSRDASRTPARRRAFAATQERPGAVAFACHDGEAIGAQLR